MNSPKTKKKRKKEIGFFITTYQDGHHSDGTTHRLVQHQTIEEYEEAESNAESSLSFVLEELEGLQKLRKQQQQQQQ